MIRPIDAYPGKVATPTAEYPDGKAQNITSPGDGTGTPWEAQLVNDLFGFQQFITAKAGITPNGTPDNATASQQFDALWKLLNVRAVTVNVVSDADITLTADQNLYGNLTITDTGVVLTAARDIIVDTVGRIFLFTNSTAQTLTVKTLAGTGVEVAAGASTALVCDETDVLDFARFSAATPTSEIKIFPTASIPIGFLECNGAEISRAVYADLFAVVGTTYGVGDGSTTFNIPDLRGEFIRGWDNGRGIDTGRTIGTSQTDDNKSHSHSITDQTTIYDDGASGVWGLLASSATGNPNGPLSGQCVRTIGTTGSEARPRNIAMMYCIKY